MAGFEYAYNGSAGEAYVEAEFLARGWNVTVPDVDGGDDLVVVRHADHQMARVQVKTAGGESRRYGYSAGFTLNHDPVDEGDGSEKYYIFVMRLPKRWGPMVVLPQEDLEALVVEEEMGTDGESTHQFYMRYHEEEGAIAKVDCSDVELTEYMGDFSHWPPVG